MPVIEGGLASMFSPRFVAVAVAAWLAAGCAEPGRLACAAGQQPMVSEVLYFGSARPSGVVTADEWQAFLGGVVTPRFPQGLSVWQAAGQWRSNAGPIVREGSHVLNIVHAAGDAEDRSLDEIVAEYKRRFQQDAVLRVRSPACVTF